MDLKQLRYFVTVAHERNFSRAAERCHVTQPTLSQGVQSLEEFLGEPLFIRHPRNIQLTKAGTELLERATIILNEAEGIENLFQQRGDLQHGSVTIGIIPTLAPFLLPQILVEFRKAHPHISLHIKEGQTSVLIAATVAGDVDFSLTSDVEKSVLNKWSLFLKPLFTEQLMLAMNSNHPLASKENISPKDIKNESLIFLTEGHCFREQSIKVCLKKSLETGDTIECEQLSTILALVQSELGLAIIPQMACQPGSWRKLRFIPFKAPTPSRQIALLKKRGQALSPAAEALSASILKATQMGKA
ncbi:LysR family transcriptional regulator [Rubellicoccus peritrichatus]|uniref:LysR family transcriptional regulator n=1 Tax=Rubellicoccus peritrichatus TaxID=3080537 RepID=A0AAQ3QRW2_9BACT|nr:LysR family transcriptional regulator [Puniceicoccus sp. CR14]WOO41708.1 LysR family transcriptional regulator [Puniceicoccus sp. CR14]